MFLSTLPIYLSIYLSTYLSTYLSICLSIYQPIYLSIYRLIDLLNSIYLSIGFICLSFYLPVYLCMCISTLPVYLSLSIYYYPVFFIFFPCILYTRHAAWIRSSLWFAGYLRLAKMIQWNQPDQLRSRTKIETSEPQMRNAHARQFHPWFGTCWNMLELAGSPMRTAAMVFDAFVSIQLESLSTGT